MVQLRHATVAVGTDAGDGEINKAAWNADHTLTGTANTVLTFNGSGASAELDAAAARTFLGLGTLATQSGSLGDYALSADVTTALAGKQASGDYATNAALTSGLATKQPTGAYLTSITSGNVTTALGFTPYNATNPNGYISSITSGNVTTALGYTPTSVTGLTGTQSVAAFKTGLSLTKTDVGLANVTNTAQQPLDADLTAIAALAGTSGLLKKTAADTWTLDTTAYTANTGTVTGVTGTAPIVSSGGTAPAISINAATTSTAGSMSAADKTKLDTVATNANVGTVTSVSVVSANGFSGTVATATSTPAITLSQAAATTSAAGSMSAADKTKLDGLVTPSRLDSALAADVQMPTTNAWANGPSVTCTTGTWLLLGQATIERTTATAAHYAVRFAGSGSYGSTQGWNTNVAHTINLACFGVVTVAGASEVVTLQGLTSVGATTALMKAAIPQAAVGNNATRVIAIRIA